MSHIQNAYMSYLTKKGIGEQGMAGPQGPQGPQGLIGPDGKSAYQIWQEQGNSGSVNDYLKSIEGKSAYQVWLDIGNYGTEIDFINSFKPEEFKSALYFNQFIAEQDQIRFNVGKDFDETQTMVFLNSALIRDWSKNNNYVEIPTATMNDRINVYVFEDEHPFTSKHFTAIADQTSFDIESDFDASSIMVFLNSSLIRDWNKSVNNLIIPTALINDIIDVYIFTNNESFDYNFFDVIDNQKSFDLGDDFAKSTTMVFLNSSLIREWVKYDSYIEIPSAVNGDIVDVFSFIGEDITNSFIDLNDTPLTYEANKPLKVNSSGTGIEMGGIDGSDIVSGVISIDRLPSGAVPVLHIVYNETERFSLTHPPVNKGDTVKQNDTSEIFYVIDETNLNSAAGYEVYSASTDWNNISGKPNTFTPSSHNNTAHSTNYADETITITAGTGLSGGGNLTANRTLSVDYGTTAGTACQGNDSRLASDRTRKTTVSTSNPSGGADGDVWLKY